MPGLLPSGARGGLMAPLKAWSFLRRQPRLWPLAVAPFVISLGLLALFFWLGYNRLGDWARAWLPQGQGWWWALLRYLLALLAGLALLALQVYLLALVGGVIAAPFLEALTRRVEALAAPQAPQAWAETRWLAGMARALGQAGKRLGLYLLVMLVLLALNLLPLVGSLLYGASALAAACCFLTLEFLDYPLERRGLSLRRKLGYVLDLRLRGLAFGAAVCLLGVVPLVNLLLLPLAAVGGTLLYLECPLPSPPRAPSPPAPPAARQA